MKRVICIIFILLFSVRLFSQSKEYLITSNSVGSVTLGMTIKQAIELIKPERYERIGPGDSGFHTYIKEYDEVLFSMYSSRDQNYIINPDVKIEVISVFNERFKTQDQVYPGMLLKEVEKKWGKLKEIVISDADSGEYAKFEKQPKKLTLKVDGGKFKEGERRTDKYEKDGKIYCISISMYDY
jgi:hypothetical protein